MEMHNLYIKNNINILKLAIGASLLYLLLNLATQIHSSSPVIFKTISTDSLMENYHP
jgi:hypothetical protein